MVRATGAERHASLLLNRPHLWPFLSPSPSSSYHQSCDTVNNVDHWVLKKHMTAAAYVLMQLGQSKSLAILN